MLSLGARWPKLDSETVEIKTKIEYNERLMKTVESREIGINWITFIIRIVVHQHMWNNYWTVITLTHAQYMHIAYRRAYSSLMPTNVKCLFICFSFRWARIFNWCCVCFCMNAFKSDNHYCNIHSCWLQCFYHFFSLKFSTKLKQKWTWIKSNIFTSKLERD